MARIRLPHWGSRNRRAHLGIAVGLALLAMMLLSSALQPTSALFQAQVPSASLASISTADLVALSAVGQEILDDDGAQFGWQSPAVRPDQATVYQVLRTVGNGEPEVLSALNVVAHPDGPAGALLFTDPLPVPAPGTEVFYQVTYAKGLWRSAQALEITLVAP